MYIAMVVAALIGALVGEWIRRRTSRLSYRLPRVEQDTNPAQAGSVGEDVDQAHEVAEADLPRPGHRYWMTVVLGLVWAGIVAAAWPHGVAMVWWAALTSIGLYLAAVDIDVRRLPDRAQAGLAGVAVIGGIILAWSEPTRILRALIAAALCGVVFWVIHIIGRGQMGFGDVKLIATCGWILALSSWQAVFAGLMAGCLLALGYAAVTRSRAFAFGPWLLLGTTLAGVGLGTF